jgi:DNA-nicking Smr family endonuclease
MSTPPRRKPGHPAEKPVAAVRPAPVPAREPQLERGARLHGLDALGGLRTSLKDDSARREAARQQAERQTRETEQASQVFRHEIGAVQPLKTPPRHSTTRTPPPAPLPLQTRLDEAAVLSEAISDEYDPEVLLDVDESISFCRPGIGQEIVRKLRRGTWIVQAQIDLHGMRREEAREALAEFLRDAVKRGLRCVRVIHGKGLGSVNKEPVLKGKVRAWLVQKAEVIAFCQARPHDGGAGAVVVLLQPAPALRAQSGKSSDA